MKALAVLQLSLPPAPPASWEAQPGPAAQAPAWAPQEAPHPPATDQSQPAPGFSATEPPDGAPGAGLSRATVRASAGAAHVPLLSSSSSG